jgi:hypothetical protein
LSRLLRRTDSRFAGKRFGDLFQIIIRTGDARPVREPPYCPRVDRMGGSMTIQAIRAFRLTIAVAMITVAAIWLLHAWRSPPHVTYITAGSHAR